MLKNKQKTIIVYIPTCLVISSIVILFIILFLLHKFKIGFNINYKYIKIIIYFVIGYS